MCSRVLVVLGAVMSMASAGCSGAAAAPQERPPAPDDREAHASFDGEETGAATCGDGVIDPGEECDGSDLGGSHCSDLGPAFIGGELACSAHCTFVPSACEIAVSAPLVVINEVTSIAGDAIELYNAGDSTVDLGGWSLSDTEVASAPTRHDDRFVVPVGTVLDPRAHLVLHADDHGLGLSGAGDFVALVDRELVVRDRVGFDADEAADSYCRIPDGPRGAWQRDCKPSFGGHNRR